MKLLLITLFVLNTSHLFAIKILPYSSNTLKCTNIKTHKTILIKRNTKVTAWYMNEQNISVKIRGSLSQITDSFVYVRKNQRKENVKIPIHKLESISKRYALKTIESIAAFIPTSIISVGVIKLLSKVSKNNNTTGNTPNDGNGLAGVVGIVMGIIIFPLFILSSIFMLKQLTYKKMQKSKGWLFTPSKN
jgi:hypothetical protein